MWPLTPEAVDHDLGTRGSDAGLGNFDGDD
jgi:hypothetical protein